MPGFVATDVMAAHSEAYSSRCSCKGNQTKSLTARSPTSGEHGNLLALLHPLKGRSLQDSRTDSTHSLRVCASVIPMHPGEAEAGVFPNAGSAKRLAS